MQGCGRFYFAAKYSVVHIHTPALSLSLSSHLDDHSILGRVPSAVQQVPVGHSFRRPQYAPAVPHPQALPCILHLSPLVIVPLPKGNFAQAWSLQGLLAPEGAYFSNSAQEHCTGKQRLWIEQRREACSLLKDSS